ncbi:hypothetical protein Acr_04g0000670 [Actinidia rufa]|uniref:Uncharacterized protein n=1 Tax=Actinidia rufa TaxID=165716 RepID=A0A7J0EHE0_9ERIC|nr:hypothetical protein Acr_04g0000670 [Actinidia rufa]
MAVMKHCLAILWSSFTLPIHVEVVNFIIRLYTSSLACPLASLAFFFLDELEDPPDPNLPWIGLVFDFFGPLHKFFILDFHEHLGYRSVQRRQYQVELVRWRAGTSVASPSPSILVCPLSFCLVPIVCLLGVGFLLFVIIPSLPLAFGLGQFFYCDVLVGFALECRQGVNGVNPGVQVLNLLSGGFILDPISRNSLLAWNANLLIDDNSWPNAHDQCYGNVGNLDRLIDESKRSLNNFWSRCDGRWRRRIVCGEVLYNAGILFIHDSYLFGDPMHLTMKALKIGILNGVRHRMCYVIYKGAGTWSRGGTVGAIDAGGEDKEEDEKGSHGKEVDGEEGGFVPVGADEASEGEEEDGDAGGEVSVIHLLMKVSFGDRGGTVGAIDVGGEDKEEDEKGGHGKEVDGEEGGFVPVGADEASEGEEEDRDAGGIGP